MMFVRGPEMVEQAREAMMLKTRQDCPQESAGQSNLHPSNPACDAVEHVVLMILNPASEAAYLP